MMGIDILNALKTLHRVGYCHQDLKLENICFKDGQYRLIDFGCSSKILDEKDLKNARGNLMFASIQQFTYRIRPSDDIESLLYVMAYCIDSFKLPWSFMSVGATLQEYIDLRIKSAHTFFDYFVQEMPEPLGKAFTYIRSLSKRT